MVLVGASGSGKSTWAARQYRAQEVVSSDALRAVVGSGEFDLDASADAFAVLNHVVAARLRRGLTTVVDSLGLDPDARERYRQLGKAAGLPCVAVVFEASAAICRARNARRDVPVPARVLQQQLGRLPAVRAALAEEGWDLVRVVTSEDARSG